MDTVTEAREQSAAPAVDGLVVPDISYESLLDCVHCGICLSACPTFQLLGTEADSPRGRIYFMRALAEGRTEVTPTLAHHIDTCLGCRACETACPSGVHYGELLAQTRAYVEKHHQRSAEDQRARRSLLDLLTNPGRLRLALQGARLAQRIPGGAAVAERVQRYLFGPKAPEMPLPADAGTGRLPARVAARGEQRGRVVLLTGCVMSVLFHRVHEATARLLAANGYEVLIPAAQGCCGSMHMHVGYTAEARTRAEQLIAALEGTDADAIISNSAGCGSAMKEYAELFHGDREWEERAQAFSGRVRDVTEFLASVGLRAPDRPLPRRVVYHDACHLAHAQGIRAQPRSLLGQIPQIELVEFVDSDVCCGSAGIYNFLQPELAARLQEQKVRNLLAAQPELVATGNPGCHNWIEAGLRAAGSPVPVKHTAEVLAEAYG
jgi:glycolate oxidase iron-sulfur subunit